MSTMQYCYNWYFNVTFIKNRRGFNVLSLKNKSPDSYNVSIANDNNELLSSKI